MKLPNLKISGTKLTTWKKEWMIDVHRDGNIHASVRVLSDKGVGSWTGLKQPLHLGRQNQWPHTGYC